ncbi:hypothetical protein E2C01_015317 [Portunus trituberculatus]|uniref:Uncharacterized protein n=1 Tax=Portunus trituberculatus TaxID=210409 RepID=A0A5B7DMV2_PORTR|nr:hypothetical protein [Portunus trituberculatus]
MHLNWSLLPSPTLLIIFLPFLALFFHFTFLFYLSSSRLPIPAILIPSTVLLAFFLSTSLSYPFSLSLHSPIHIPSQPRPARIQVKGKKTTAKKNPVIMPFLK